MDYLRNAERRIIDGHEISFVRCDKFGNEIPAEKLKEMSFSNSTIDRIVSDVAGRVANDGIFTQDISTDSMMSD